MDIGIEACAEVAIVGAGPIGIELAVALQECSCDFLHFEAGQVGQTFSWFPRQMEIFSSPGRLEICGVPLMTLHHGKVTREQYLSYLRLVVKLFDLEINSYEKVTAIEPGAEGFLIRTQRVRGPACYRVQKVVLTTGNMHRPRLLSIPGEDQQQVSHYFDEAHR